jgi:hypothetical protein
MARPTDYTPALLKKAKEYLANYEELGDAIPSIAGLAVELQVSRDTIYDWRKHEDKKEFSDILQDILSTQERILVSKGLKGEFNSNIAKLALGKHGYTDKQDVTSDGKALPLAGIEISVRE